MSKLSNVQTYNEIEPQTKRAQVNDMVGKWYGDLNISYKNIWNYTRTYNDSL